MRKRIQNLVYGKVKEPRPKVRFSSSMVEIEAFEGERQTGSFEIKSVNRVPLNGMIYSSHPLVECKENLVQGTQCSVPYELNSEGLQSGDILEGEFLLVTNQGEYSLSFVVKIKKYYPQTSQGEINSLEKFIELAKSSEKEAFQIFTSPYMLHVFQEYQAKEKLIYMGLLSQKASRMSMEEFVAGIGAKETVHLTLMQENALFEPMNQTEKKEIVLRKDHWGYIEVMLSANADFIQLPKSNYTTDDFVGNVCKLEYLIVKEKLHAGKNIGEICIRTPYETFQFQVTVQQSMRRSKNENKKYESLMMQSYIDYRLQRNPTSVWVSETAHAIDAMELDGEKKWYYHLWRAQTLIGNRQRQDARLMVQKFKEEYPHTDTPLWAYYLYLTTLLESEKSLIQKRTTEIRDIYKRYSESRLIFWILLFLDTDFEDPGFKLMEIERAFFQGCASPAIYLEAYISIYYNPYILTKLGRFELSELLWMKKMHLITREIALQIAKLVHTMSRFDKKVIQLLEFSYQIYPEDEILSAMTQYLIQGRCFGSEYFTWYEQAVKRDLKVQRLYDAYILSADHIADAELPQEILRYFAFKSKLPFSKRAQVYVNVWKHRKEAPETFEQYRRQIDEFVLEQIEAKHIDEHLAQLYELTLEQTLITPQTAKQLAEVLYTCKFTLKKKKIAKIIVLQEAFSSIRTFLAAGEETYITVYPGKHAILYEDIHGRIYCNKGEGKETALFTGKNVRQICHTMVTDDVPVLLEQFEQAANQKERVQLAKGLLHTDVLSRFFRGKMQELVLDAYATEQDWAQAGNHIAMLSAKEINRSKRKILMQAFDACSLYDKSYEMLQMIGSQDAEAAFLLKTALAKIAKKEAADDFLNYLTYQAFLLGAYNETSIQYLCNYFWGKTLDMAQIWSAARECQADTYEIEERMLIQMMYTNVVPKRVEDIFQSYFAAGGNKKVRLAYFSFMSYRYLVDERAEHGRLTGQLQLLLEQGREMTDVCKLALLKSCVQKKELDSLEQKSVKLITQEMVTNGCYLAFYKDLSAEVRRAFMLDGIDILQYNGYEDSIVKVHYKRGSQYKTEPLKHVCCGLFAKPLVVLEGEEIPYYLTVQRGRTMQIAECGILKASNQSCAVGRLRLLNEMNALAKNKDAEKLQEQMWNCFQIETKIEEEMHLL